MAPSVPCRHDQLRAAVQALVRAEEFDEGWRSLRPYLIEEENVGAWSLARNVLQAGARRGWSPATRRSVRLAVLSSYEVSELAAHLDVACRLLGAEPEMYVAPFGQIEQ